MERYIAQNNSSYENLDQTLKEKRSIRCKFDIDSQTSNIQQKYYHDINFNVSVIIRFDLIIVKSIKNT